jgi:signal transduction histidine kinase
MKQSRKLQQIINASWMMSGGTALVASLFLFSLFAFYNYRSELNLVQSELDSKTQIIARRLSSELLLAPRGSPDAVASQLQIDLNLSDVRFGSDEDIRKIPRINNFAYSQLKMPFLEDNYSVLTATPKRDIWYYFKLGNLLISVCLIGLFAGSGLYFQTRYFRKYLVRPIESLVDTSTGEKSISSNWPIEIQEISQKLNTSFQEREQSVYSQIARGVIHDIKTILQSLQIATDLAKEAPTETRYKNLLKVSSEKLPSLLSIVQTALDGSREISVQQRNLNLVDTLKKSVETSQSLPIAKNIQLRFQNPNQELLVNHDQIQVERVFTNIIKNAFEAVESNASDKKGIHISFRCEHKDFVSVVIEDSGAGLPSYSESTVRPLRSTKPHGSGLGLLVSKKIIEAHKGEITVSRSSELGGAKFEVKIPRETLI